MCALTREANAIQIQSRDLAVLRGLFESRIMTAGHIAAIHFTGSQEAAKKRLQKLKSAGLIGERRRRAFEPAILFLTGKAMDVLRNEGVLLDYPALDANSLIKRSYISELTIRHELEVMDVKAAFHSAITGKNRYSIQEFSTWPMLNQFKACRPGIQAQEVIVKPDGFIRIQSVEPEGAVGEYSFFLEVDRSTETQDTLVNRVGCYADYFRSGGFALRNGAKRSDFKDYAFRVLLVLKNQERRNNTAERLLLQRPAILTQAYLTTLDEIVANPLGDIWARPIDFLEITKGTPYEPREFLFNRGYKRQAARELFVEQKLKKLSLVKGD